MYLTLVKGTLNISFKSSFFISRRTNGCLSLTADLNRVSNLLKSFGVTCLCGYKQRNGQEMRNTDRQTNKDKQTSKQTWRQEDKQTAAIPTGHQGTCHNSIHFL